MIFINVFDSNNQAQNLPASAQVTDSLIPLLEAQLGQLQAQKSSNPSAAAPRITTYSGSSGSPSPPSSPSSFRSLDSDDLPQLREPPSFSLSEPAKKAPLLKKNVKKPDTDVASRILTLIEGYGQNEANKDNNAWYGRVAAEPRVRKCVDAGAPIDLVLPAFPWKSVNKVEKVTGALPDLGEELGLGRLQNMCEDIEAIYPPGAYCCITSDGLVYADLLGIPDKEVYYYGLALRQMAEEKGYDRLKFIRIMNLLGLTDSPHMTEEEYLAAVPESRKTMMDKFLPPSFDCQEAILSDIDVNLTYCGYMLFLAKDLRHSPITEGVTGKNEYKRIVKGVAQDMITRGKAFAAAIDDALPGHVRLSIHRSVGTTKLSFPLVPQPDHFSMTPWHCSIAVTHKGQFRTAHANQLRGHYDLIEQNGRPYYFRDRSDVWKWDVPVEFEFFYPRGVYVKANPAQGEPAPKLGPAEVAKLKQLGKGFSTAIPLGFA